MAKMSYIEDIQSIAELQLPWDILSGCNILVTGATGLIGSCLVEVLMARPNRDYSVFAMGRDAKRMGTLFSKYDKNESFNMILCDITSPIQLKQSFHYIIHCASGAAPKEFVQHPVEVMKANIQGTFNLMDYGINHSMRRMLYVSSGEVYGEGDGDIFREEDSGYVDCTSPRSCYPSSKRAAETICVSYASEYGTDVVIARPCHVYGPHFTERDNRVYAQFIRNVLCRENIIMKSTGEQFRSWCYVVDCVSALLHILFKGECQQAYNIADKESTVSIKQLANMIAEIGGCQVVLDLSSTEEAKGYNPVKKSVFSVEKLEQIGWCVGGSMKEKLSNTIDECRRLGV